MRYVALFLGLYFVTFSSFAASNNSLNLAIKNSANQSAEVADHNSAPSIIYGGQDISRQTFALAHESLWAGQPTLVG